MTGEAGSQTMRLIQLPQAITLMLPAIVSQLVVVLKDTALGGQLTVGYTELVRTSGANTGNFANTIPTLTVVAILFIVLNFLLSPATYTLQRRLSRSQRLSPGAAADGPGYQWPCVCRPLTADSPETIRWHGQSHPSHDRVGSLKSDIPISIARYVT